MAAPTGPSFLGALVQRVLTVLGAVTMTTTFFLVLPIIQAISAPPANDLVLNTVETAMEPPPPPPPEEEIEEEEPEEEEPPQLEEQAQPLDLSQLELALDPGGLSDGWTTGDFAVDLGSVTDGAKDVDALFSLADLDQAPRAIYQPSPVLDAKVRKKAPGTVYILFIVDERGRVQDPIVQSSPDPVFERPALNAIKKWRFEPGKRKGEAVRFRMRVPITFPKG